MQRTPTPSACLKPLVQEGLLQSRLLDGSPDGHAVTRSNPEIVIEHISNGSMVWRRSLAEVDDDMQTRYIRAQRSELPFTLQVSSSRHDHGQGEGTAVVQTSCAGPEELALVDCMTTESNRSFC